MQKKPKSEKKVLISAKVHPTILKDTKKYSKKFKSFSQYVERSLDFFNLHNGTTIS
jgi:hypothetical protein